MGFRLPATIHFDQMVLADESSEKNLLIQLADRNIVSAETVVERFGEIPEIEKIRIKREERERKGESMPQKAGPYHNPQHKNDIEKIALQKGDIGAEDLGIIPSEETGPHPFTNPEDRVSREVKDEAAEEEMRKQQQREKEFDQVGRPEDGRPKNARDQVKRKQKEVLPRETVKSDFVNLLLWTNDAQKTISEIVHPAILAHYNKKNLRALNKQQSGELEYIKLCVLCNLKPYEEINAGLVNDILKSGSGVNQTVAKTITSLKSGFIKTNKRSPNIDERKQMSANAYASFHTT